MVTDETDRSIRSTRVRMYARMHAPALEQVDGDLEGDEEVGHRDHQVRGVGGPHVRVRCGVGHGLKRCCLIKGAWSTCATRGSLESRAAIQASPPTTKSPTGGCQSGVSAGSLCSLCGGEIAGFGQCRDRFGGVDFVFRSMWRAAGVGGAIRTTDRIINASPFFE